MHAPPAGETILSDDANPAAALPFEPGRYPRTYRFPVGVRLTLSAMAIAVVAIGVFIATSARTPRHGEVMGLWMLDGILFAVASWMQVLAVRTRLVLSADGLDHRGAFLSRHLSTAQILGRRRTHNSRRGMRIVPRPGHGRALPISGDLQRDAHFEAWFARFADLDAAEHAASLANLLQDRGLGATPRDVGDRLAHAKLLARIGAVASLALLVELRVGPALWESTIDVTIAMCMPLVALLAAGLVRGLVTLTPRDRDDNDARPSLFPMIMLPSIGVLLRVPPQSNFSDWKALVLPAIIGGALGTAYAMTIDVGLRRRIGAALGTLAGMGIFAAAAYLWLDVRADISSVTPVRAAVTGRWSGKAPGGGIGLGPAATVADWASVRVTRATLDDLQIGSIACLSEHPGLFGLR